MPRYDPGVREKTLRASSGAFGSMRHLEASSVALTQARGMIAASQQQTKPTGKASNGSRNDALDGESVPTHLVDVHLSEHSWSKLGEFVLIEF